MAKENIANLQINTDPNIVAKYREHLIGARQKAQEDYDKAVLSLSGGALGISFIFVKDFIGQNPIVSPHLLMYAWISWGVSSLAILVSFYMSHLSLDTAIQQIDKGEYRYRPGGVAVFFTNLFNAAGGVLFCTGVGLIASFAYFNMR